jgi:hypothetical protein
MLIYAFVYVPRYMNNKILILILSQRIGLNLCTFFAHSGVELHSPIIFFVQLLIFYPNNQMTQKILNQGFDFH